MEFFTFTKPGGEWNEDRVFACEDFAFVLDGATNITGEKYSNFSSDAEWYSNWWCEYLKVELYDKTKTIPDILKVGLKKVTKEYQKLCGEHKVIDFPSATSSIVRRINGQLEIYSLSDSAIIIKSINGVNFLIQDPLNLVNDGFNVMRMKECKRKEGGNLIEVRKKHNEILLKGRLKNNTFGGAYILSNDPKAVEHGIYNSIEEHLVEKLLILSDGYAQVYDVVRFMTSDELIEKINSLDDVNKIYNKLYKYQESDKDVEKYPRFKLRDDATLVFMKF